MARRAWKPPRRPGGARRTATAIIGIASVSLSRMRQWPASPSVFSRLGDATACDEQDRKQWAKPKRVSFLAEGGDIPIVKLIVSDLAKDERVANAYGFAKERYAELG